MINKYNRLIYKKDIIKLLKFLNDRLISRLVDTRKITLIIDKIEFIFSSNKLIYSNIRKRINMRRSIKLYAISFKQNNTAWTELLICRKRTFLKRYKKVRQRYKFEQRIISCFEISVLNSITTDFLQSICIIICTFKSLEK